MTIPTTSNMESSKKTAWSGKVLIPLWTLQVMAVLTNIAGYIWYLSTYDSNGYYYDYYDQSTYTPDHTTFAYISSIILVILWSIALMIVIFEIVRFHKKNLPAKTMLTSQIILSVFSGICFVIEILGLFVLPGGFKSIMDFAGTVAATGFFVGTLIYTSVIHHRRKLAKRQSTNSYGMTDYDEEAVSGKDHTRVEVVN